MQWCSSLSVEVSKGSWAGQGSAAQARTMQGSYSRYGAGRAQRLATN